MNRLNTAVVEDYLKGIFVLEESGGIAVTTTRLAHHLGVTVSAVSWMVRRLTEAGLVDHRPYGDLSLSSEGRNVAAKVLRRRRVIESYLVDVLEYGWDEVDSEAEILEHAVSDRLVECMANHLGHPTRDPHGDPIPAPSGEVVAQQTWRISTLAPGDSGTLARVSDDPPGLLRWLREHGIGLGDNIEVLGFGANGVLNVRVGEDREMLSLGINVLPSLEVTLGIELSGS